MRAFLTNYIALIDEIKQFLIEKMLQKGSLAQEWTEIFLKREMFCEFIRNFDKNNDLSKELENNIEKVFNYLLPFPSKIDQSFIPLDTLKKKFLPQVFEKWRWVIQEGGKSDKLTITPYIFEIIYNFEKGRQTKGVVSTPIIFANKITKKAINQYFIIESSKRKADIEFSTDIKVLDIATGCGTFYLEIVRILVNRNLENNTLESKKRVILDVIRNCAYGIDIDKEALLIARIRLLFLAIQFLQEVDLDFLKNLIQYSNLIHGNAIIGLVKPNSSSINEYDDFTTKNKIERELFEEQIPFHWYDKLPEIIENGGFDIILGNPPYIGYGSIHKDQKDVLKVLYPEIYSGLNDLMYFFVARALELVKPGKGIIGLLISRYFLEARYSSKLRSYCAKNSWITHIIDFREFKFFDVISNNVIVIFMRRKGENTLNKINTYYSRLISTKITIEDLVENILDQSEKDNSNLFKNITLNEKQINEHQWLLVPLEINVIIERIQRESGRLGDVCHTGTGFHTGKDQIFIKNLQKGENGFFATISDSNNQERVFPLESELIKEIIKTPDILPFIVCWEAKYVILVERHTNINQYPLVYEYLLNFKDELSSRYECKKGLAKWYEIAQIRNKDFFSRKQKIVCPYRAPIPRFAIENKMRFHSIDCTTIVLKKESNFTEYFVLGVLNSALFEFLIQMTAKKLDAKKLELYPKYLSDLPFKIPKTGSDKELVKQIEINVEKLSILLKNGEISKKRKRNILDSARRIKSLHTEEEIYSLIRRNDELVYDLYGISKDEIDEIEKIVLDF